MTLYECAVGDTVQITKINLDEAVKRRLEILGMTGNAKVEILNRKCGGAMIIRLRGTRFALGRQFAEGIVAEAEGYEK